MDTTEGLHKPLGRYIFNNVNFSRHDPLVGMLIAANYRWFENPTDPDGVIIALPVRYDDVKFDIFDGMEVNLESAIAQLERYKLLQNNWTQQNTSVTISYDPTEVPGMITWLLDNWDIYVGVSFLYRNDPTKTAEDLGFKYLPQQVVTKEQYDSYVSELLEVDIAAATSFAELTEEDCLTGACPIK